MEPWPKEKALKVRKNHILEIALVVFLSGGSHLGAQDLDSPQGGPDETLMVAARDGTELATNVFFPPGSGEGPWPVILLRSPYGKDNLIAHCRDIAGRGYTVVCQDTRGARPANRLSLKSRSIAIC